MRSHATSHHHNWAWKAQQSRIKLVSAEEVPSRELAGPVDSGVRSERATHASACHSLAGPDCGAGNLCPQEDLGPGAVKVRALISGESSGRTNRTVSHPKHRAQPSLSRTSLAFLAWEQAARKTSAHSWPGQGPRGGRRMQPPGGLQGPRETEPVLKRQGGWRPCLGRLPGMPEPGLEAWSLLALGSLSSRQGGRS